MTSTVGATLVKDPAGGEACLGTVALLYRGKGQAQGPAPTKENTHKYL